jgi:hypothetical protein
VKNSRIGESDISPILLQAKIRNAFIGDRIAIPPTPVIVLEEDQRHLGYLLMPREEGVDSLPVLFLPAPHQLHVILKKDGIARSLVFSRSHGEVHTSVQASVLDRIFLVPFRRENRIFFTQPS